MPATEAQLRAIRKYEKSHYFKATAMLPKDYKERIQATGKTVNGFIREAVDKYLSEIEKSDNV